MRSVHSLHILLINALRAGCSNFAKILIRRPLYVSILLILLAGILYSLVLFPQQPPKPAFAQGSLSGDFNGDGQITAADFKILLSHMPSSDTQYDLTSDDKANSLDFAKLLKLYESLPSPSPSPTTTPVITPPPHAATCPFPFHADADMSTITPDTTLNLSTGQTDTAVAIGLHIVSPDGDPWYTADSTAYCTAKTHVQVASSDNNIVTVSDGPYPLTGNPECTSESPHWYCADDTSHLAKRNCNYYTVVSPKAAGTATINYTVDGYPECTSSITVNVSSAPLPSVSPSPTASPSPSSSPSPSPSPVVYQNSASGKNCSRVCTDNGKTFQNAGTDANATNGKYWNYSSGTCTELSLSGGNTVMISQPGDPHPECSGILSQWTNCLCQ